MRPYKFAGQHIAVRQNGALFYLHGDHLGSTSVTTDHTGAKTHDVRYFAYGAPRTGDLFALPTDHTFTGQKLDRGTGLMYYGARYYDPALGMFLSPDTVVPEPGNPQALNRYAYVNNNPLRYTDPSGHWLETAWDILNIGWDIQEIRQDPGNLWNWGALVVDVGTALLPGVPAFAGVVSKGGKAAKAAVEVASHADEVGDAGRVVAKAAGHADDAADVLRGVENASDTLRRIPLGFKNTDEFAQFGARLKGGLEKAGYEGVQAIFQGSSVTGVK